MRKTDSPIHDALRAAICVPTRRYLWTPADGIEFVPALSSTVFGDGRALVTFTTINNRPAFYVVRVDSSWRLDNDVNAPDDAPELRDFVDQICEALEEEFGCARADSEETDAKIIEHGNPWPAFDDEGGCMWERLDWPRNLPHELFIKHPFAGQGRILASGE